MGRVVYAFDKYVLKADLLTVSKGEGFAKSVVSTSDKIGTIVKMYGQKLIFCQRIFCQKILNSL